MKVTRVFIEVDVPTDDIEQARLVAVDVMNNGWDFVDLDNHGLDGESGVRVRVNTRTITEVEREDSE
jgi:hypothetical protein